MNLKKLLMYLTSIWPIIQSTSFAIVKKSHPKSSVLSLHRWFFNNNYHKRTPTNVKADARYASFINGYDDYGNQNVYRAKAIQNLNPLANGELAKLAWSSSLNIQRHNQTSSVPLGIILGRPMAAYDGRFYVPVYYPSQWIVDVPYGSYDSAALESFLGRTLEQPDHHHGHHRHHDHDQLNLIDQFDYDGFMNSASTERQIIRDHGHHNHWLIPSSSNRHTASYWKNRFDEMANGDHIGHVGHIPSTGYYHHSYEPYSRTLYPLQHIFGPYYIGPPIIKLQDPHAHLKLALEASREQIEAEKRFATEVLLLSADQDHYDSDYERMEQISQPNWKMFHGNNGRMDDHRQNTRTNNSNRLSSSHSNPIPDRTNSTGNGVLAGGHDHGVIFNSTGKPESQSNSKSVIGHGCKLSTVNMINNPDTTWYNT